MTGITVSGTGVGTMIIPPIAGWLITSYGWRIGYVVMGVLALVLIVTTAQFLRRDPTQVGQLPYGNEKESQNLETGGFSLRQAIRTKQFWAFSLLWACFIFSVQIVMVHIVPHAIELDISATIAASILTVIGVSSITGRVVVGGVGDTIGNKLALKICFILMVGALFWLLAAKELWMLYLFAVAFAFAHGGHVPLGSPIVAELFGLSSHGVIFGVTAFIATTGGAIGPVLAGRIFDITSSYQLAFLVCAIVSIVGLMLILLVKPTSNKRG